jgi:hypothetical protein
MVLIAFSNSRDALSPFFDPLSRVKGNNPQAKHARHDSQLRIPARARRVQYN